MIEAIGRRRSMSVTVPNDLDQSVPVTLVSWKYAWIHEAFLMMLRELGVTSWKLMNKGTSGNVL